MNRLLWSILFAVCLYASCMIVNFGKTLNCNYLLSPFLHWFSLKWVAFSYLLSGDIEISLATLTRPRVEKYIGEWFTFLSQHKHLTTTEP